MNNQRNHQTTHAEEDAHYQELANRDESRAIWRTAIEQADRAYERRQFWRDLGNALLWVASCLLIVAMLTVGAWLPPLLVLFGWSK